MTKGKIKTAAFSLTRIAAKAALLSVIGSGVSDTAKAAGAVIDLFKKDAPLSKSTDCDLCTPTSFLEKLSDWFNR